MKDKSRLLVLAALVLLFVALSSGGHMFDGFRLFGPNRLMTILMLAAIFWFVCGGCKGRCGWSGKADAVDSEADLAHDDTDSESDQEQSGETDA